MAKITLSIVLLVLFAWLVLTNANPVPISFFIWNYSVSLSLIILGAFAVGAVVSLLGTLSGVLKRQSVLKRLQKNESALAEENRILKAKIAAPESDTTPAKKESPTSLSQ